MLLKNKKTGEIREIKNILVDGMFTVNSLAELNEEWEDYEEPKVGYIIDPMDEDGYSRDDDCFEESDRQRAKELGIWLETEEEAKKAVEKLKAWKRLKDNSWKPAHYNIATREASVIFSTGYTITEQDRKDLDLLFSQEDD